MGQEHGAIERIYCCDRGNDDAAWMAAFANRNNNNDWWPAMMMSNGQWNNPFIYLVWMMMAQRMGWNNGWDNDQNAQNIELQSQIEALRTQMQDNQNSNMIMDAVKSNSCDLRALSNQLGCDFNTLNAAICDVRGGIDKLSGLVGLTGERVINAVTLGNCNLLSQLKDCCCETQKEILAQSNILQRGQDFINRSIERGFAAQGFQAQQDKCDILRAGEVNTQRIIDTLNAHWGNEKDQQIQDLKFQLSQERQNRLLLSRLGGNCGNDCCDNNCGGF